MVGNRIAEMRKVRGMKQPGLASILDVEVSTIGRWEKGTRDISLTNLRHIAAALDCKVADLLAVEDCPDRLSDAERRIVDAIRADPKADPREIAAMILSLNRLIQQRVERSRMREQIGDDDRVGELAAWWGTLDEHKREQVLDMVRVIAGRRVAAVA
jgi:transcriptional regulator with XRE-family HTH domain